MSLNTPSSRCAIITALLAVGEWYALDRQQELTPFLGAIGPFLMSFIWIAISPWPMIVPFHCTLWQVASRIARGRS